METITVSEKFPVKPRKLFKAWLDAKMHSQMTGAPAEIDPAVGGKFSLRAGRVTGSNTQIVQDEKVVQKWRMTDFPKASADSVISVEFIPLEKGSELVITHSIIPDGLGETCRTFWIESYFKKMTDYFARG